jgi:hypothetical protein
MKLNPQTKIVPKSAGNGMVTLTRNGNQVFVTEGTHTVKQFDFLSVREAKRFLGDTVTF